MSESAGLLDEFSGDATLESTESDEYTVVLPAPLPYQRTALDDPHRYKALRWGRRRGKSRLALLAGVNGHGPLDDDGRPKFPGLIDGARGLWIVPEFPQARAIWEEEIRPRFANKAYCSLLQTTRTLKVGDGQLMLASAASIDSKRGSKLDFAVIDEAAYMNFSYVWNGVVRPALADRQGWAIVISTTKIGSDFNRLISTIEAGKASKDWMTQRGYTRDNPKLTRDEIAAMYAEYPPGSTDVLQELEAELVETHGTLFRAEFFHRYQQINRYAMWIDGVRYPFHEIVITVDLASSLKEAGDYFAMAVYGLHFTDASTLKIGVIDYLWHKMEGPAQIDEMERVIRQYDPTRTKIEATQYQITALQHLKLRLPHANIQPAYPDKDKRTRAVPWAAAMARGDVFWPEYAAWMETVQAQYQRFPNGAQNSKYIEDHDDLVDVGSLMGEEMTTENGGWTVHRMRA